MTIGIIRPSMTRWKFLVKFWWFAFVFRVFYMTPLKRLWNKACQWLFDAQNCSYARIPRRKIPLFSEPGQIWETLGPQFDYRHDPGGGILDYASEPEVFYWRVRNSKISDGDCDDVAQFAAACLCKMFDVSQVRILHSGFNGGAHATVVFKRGNKWFHFDYGVDPIDDPNKAPEKVAHTYTKQGKSLEVTYWVYSDINMKPLAISPKKLYYT